MSIEMSMAAGTGLMLVVMLASARHLHTPPWKTAILSVLLACAGYTGAKLMFAIEAGGRLDGRSFFGALLFVPPLMVLAALALRMPLGDALDLCAPGECVMLALLKVKCLMDGCCAGMILRTTDSGSVIRFPSQISEGGHALLLCGVLMVLIRRGRWRGQVYAWYMILYSVGRFILNLLRETEPFIWILPAGNFWSLITLAAGTTWLLLKRQRAVHTAA
ncbi:MAG: prolipoprotein diacylglyceryl transferase [Clostridia bacterium]|nr:prolipoprotein diacylglyceryl transferase [Clostridia bacterium]